MIEQWLNSAYLGERSLQKLAKEFAAAEPFSHIALHDLLRKERLQQLEHALAQQQFSRKEADLFSFFQTADLFSVKDKAIREFLALLQSEEFTAWANSITGVKTKTGKVDAAGFVYADGDHLLCHDDGLSSRKIAYIMNFSTLRAKQGGTLSLFSSNTRSEPVTIAKRITPRRNTLVLFNVTRRSHHQVDEVLGARRMTITGWLHG